MPTVFVIAQDWALRAGVRAELRESGIEALGMETVGEAARRLAEGAAPSAIVLEAGAAEHGLAALDRFAPQVPLIVVASRTETSPIPEKAAAVFYRPVRVGEIVACVQRLLRGQAA